MSSPRPAYISTSWIQLLYKGGNNARGTVSRILRAWEKSRYMKLFLCLLHSVSFSGRVIIEIFEDLNNHAWSMIYGPMTTRMRQRTPSTSTMARLQITESCAFSKPPLGIRGMRESCLTDRRCSSTMANDSQLSPEYSFCPYKLEKGFPVGAVLCIK